MVKLLSGSSGARIPATAFRHNAGVQQLVQETEQLEVDTLDQEQAL